MVFSPSMFGDLALFFLMTLDDDQGDIHKKFCSFGSKLANHPRERVQAGFVVANCKVTTSTTPFLALPCVSFQLVIHFAQACLEVP